MTVHCAVLKILNFQRQFWIVLDMIRTLLMKLTSLGNFHMLNKKCFAATSTLE